MSEKLTSVQSILIKISRFILDEGAIADSLQDICSVFNLSAAKIFVVDIRREHLGNFYSSGIPDDEKSRYETLVPEMKRMFAVPRSENMGRLYHWRDLVPVDLLAKSEYSSGKFGSMAATHAAGGFVARVNTTIAVIGLHRPSSMPDFSDEELAAMQDLMPHFANALLSRHAIEFGGANIGPLSAAVQCMSAGVLLLSESVQSAWMNDAAARLIARDDGLVQTRSGYILARNSADTLHLSKLVEEMSAWTAGSFGKSAGGMRVRREGSELPLSVMVVSLGRGLAPALVDVPVRAIMFVGDPAPRTDTSADALSLAFGLTKTEARIAAALAGGSTAAEFASGNRSSIGTVRWHIKNILAKTGLRRQSELVRLIASSPAYWLSGIAGGNRADARAARPKSDSFDRD